MIRPDQQERRHEPERDRSPRRRACARAPALRRTWWWRSCGPRAARAPRRRTPRRDGRSRETCRGSRRPATAAPCRRAARRPPRPRTASGSVAARSIVHTPSSAAAMARRIPADQHRAPHLAAEGRGERREVLALALAAGDHHQRAGQAGHRGDGRAHVGALRVVDVAHAGHVGDPLGAVLQARECLERPSIAWHGQSRRLAEGERRERIRRIVRARRFSCARCRASPRRGARASSSRPRACSVKSASLRSMENVTMRGGCGPRRTAREGLAHGEEERIVGVQHHRRRVARKSATWRARTRRPRHSDPCGRRSR